MKRVLIMLIAFVLTITVSAQEKKKGKANMAKRVTSDMTEVLGLDDATSAKVYELLSEKITELKATKKELKNDKEALKARRKEVNNDFKSKITSIVGVEKMEKWKNHLKSNKKKKK